jgi:MFS family permease
MNQDHSRKTQIALYFAALSFFGGFASPAAGLFQLPVQFYLMDQLHLPATTVAAFAAITGIPLYLGFLCGFARDRWRTGPLGLGDRGYLLLFAPLTAAVYFWFAGRTVTYGSLLLVGLLVMALYRFVAGATGAITTLVAQRLAMSGRLSVLVNTFIMLPAVASAVAGGWLVSRASAHGVLIITGVMTLVMFLLGLCKPRVVFVEGEKRGPIHRPATGAEIRRILRHRPLWVATLLWFVWNFSPGFQTPLLFFMTKTLKATGDQYGWFQGLFNLGFLPTFVLYGLLIQRFPMRSILFWSTLVAVPQMIPLLFIHSAVSALWLAGLIGLLGGVVTAAYYDLILRSCPRGLEGTAMLLVDAGYWIATRSGDLLGGWLYVRGGFALAIVITTATYALLVPALLLVPRDVTARREGDLGLETELADTHRILTLEGAATAEGTP